MKRGWVKRGMDIGVAVLGLVVTAPIQAAAAVAVRVSMGSPVLFRQARPGRGGEVFEIFKFRTMHPIDPLRGWVTDEDRLTRTGAFLRDTSIDELPALWNVLVGQMSVVGPRPLLVEYLPLYDAAQARRHEVRPGLTGLAQVSGRNALSWEERFALDVQYVDTWTVRGDLRILSMTVLSVLRQEGISAEGQVTMSRFEGTPTQSFAGGCDSGRAGTPTTTL